MRYWKRINKDGTTNTVEAYSHALLVLGAIEISQKEFDQFIKSLPPPLPSRILETEFDQLVNALRTKGVI